MRGAVIKHVTAGKRKWGGQTLKHLSLLLFRRGNELLFFQWLLCDIIDTMHRCTVVNLATSPLEKLLLCQPQPQPHRNDLTTLSIIMERTWSYGLVAG